MNKQALAFISMFTLVLMLSIYYVSLEEELPQQQPQRNDVTSVMAQMKEQNNERKEEQILDLKGILGSKEASEEKKKEILNEIDEVEANKRVEDETMAILSDHNIQSVVLVEDGIIKVNVFEIKKSNEKAAEILNLVYSKVKPNQSIELVFS